jgi:hypothetical protein
MSSYAHRPSHPGLAFTAPKPAAHPCRYATPLPGLMKRERGVLYRVRRVLSQGKSRLSASGKRDLRGRLRARAGQGVIVGGVVGEDYRKLGLSSLIAAGRMHGAAVKEQHIPRGK